MNEKNDSKLPFFFSLNSESLFPTPWVITRRMILDLDYLLTGRSLVDWFQCEWYYRGEKEINLLPSIVVLQILVFSPSTSLLLFTSLETSRSVPCLLLKVCNYSTGVISLSIFSFFILCEIGLHQWKLVGKELKHRLLCVCSVIRMNELVISLRFLLKAFYDRSTISKCIGGD